MSLLPYSSFAAPAQLDYASLFFKPKRAIGGFIAQAVIEESHFDEMQITQHPVENGATITDHAYAMPPEVTIHCAWSNSPTPGNIVGNGAVNLSGISGALSAAPAFKPGAAVTDIYTALVALKDARIPFDVYTGKRSYSNMLIRSIAVRTDKQTENALVATIQCQQLFIAKTATVLVGATAANQKAPQKTLPPAKVGQVSLQPAPNYSTAAP